VSGAYVSPRDLPLPSTAAVAVKKSNADYSVSNSVQVSGQLEERLARFKAAQNKLFICIHLLEGVWVQRQKHVGIAYIA